MSSFSLTETTLHVVVSKVELSKTKGAFTFGVVLNAEETVIVAPDTLLMFLVSTEPSGITIEIVGLLEVGMSVEAELSNTTTVVLVTEESKPPLLTPAFSESAISIMSPHLTKAPAAEVVAKAQVSAEFCSLNRNHFPNLAACPLDVQAKAFIVFVTTPYFVCVAASASTVSISNSCVIMSKY